MLELIHKRDYNYYRNSLVDLSIYTPIPSSLLPYSNHTDKYFLVIAEENMYDNTGNITEDVIVFIGKLKLNFNLDLTKTIYIEHYADVPMGSSFYPQVYNLVDFKYNIEKGIFNINWMPIYRDEIEILKTGTLPKKINDCSDGYIFLRKKYSHLTT